MDWIQYLLNVLLNVLLSTDHDEMRLVLTHVLRRNGVQQIKLSSYATKSIQLQKDSRSSALSRCYSRKAKKIASQEMDLTGWDTLRGDFRSNISLVELQRVSDTSQRHRFASLDDVDFEEVESLCSQELRAIDVPHCARISNNIPYFDAVRILELYGGSKDQRRSIMSVLNECLTTGPGCLLVENEGHLVNSRSVSSEVDVAETPCIGIVCQSKLGPLFRVEKQSMASWKRKREDLSQIPVSAQLGMRALELHCLFVCSDVSLTISPFSQRYELADFLQIHPDSVHSVPCVTLVASPGDIIFLSSGLYLKQIKALKSGKEEAAMQIIRCSAVN